MLKILATVMLVLLMLTGCLRGSRANELAALLKVAPQLMQATPAGSELPPDKWPSEVRTFDPEKVYATDDGLYIVTSSFFVNEKGLFIARSPKFVTEPGGDPEFRLIVTGLYSYEIKG